MKSQGIKKSAMAKENLTQEKLAAEGAVPGDDAGKTSRNPSTDSSLINDRYHSKWPFAINSNAFAMQNGQSVCRVS
jgi:hypothetical protein